MTPRLRRTAVASLTLLMALPGLGHGLSERASGPATAALQSRSVAISGQSEDEAGHRPRPVRRAHAATAARTSAARTSAATQLARTTSTSYTFSSVLDGKPVRWNPCTPIRWTASTGAGPAGGLAVLRTAVADIAAATGTTWTYVGPTSTKPTRGYLPKGAQTQYPPVLIGWTDGRASDLLAGQPKGVAGMTRTAWFGVRTADGRTAAATRAAVVALDRTDTLPMRGAASWEAVARHELAHAVGLGHVADPTQLMAAVLPRTTGALQAGDRAGLARLGRSAGCVTIP